MDVETGVCDRKNGGPESSRVQESRVLYSVEDRPPWYLCILLAFQHYLTAVGAMISVPLVLSEHFCIDNDHVGTSQLIGTIFFVSGLCTLLQSTFGVRLPIVQGGQFTLVTPTIAILAQRECGFRTARAEGIPESNFTAIGLPVIGSAEHRELWHSRITEIQGAIIGASIIQVVIGFSGLMGLVLRFIGPLAITPTVALVGLSLFGAGSNLASKQWWVAIMTVVLIALFSQYLKKINIPCFAYGTDKKCKVVGFPLFNLFPVLLAMLLSWAVCAILTLTGALPEDPSKSGYFARTDKSNVMQEAPWFRLPYPGQWGMPTVTAAGVFGIFAGLLASMVESVGDYYACARLCGAPPPPIHAINRGIGMEGIGCIIAGLWGSGNGTTSYSENIGAIGITKVGSRRVVQIGGILMLLLGCFGKFGALFTTIPDPVIGGMFIVAFGMVTAVGLSNLQFVDLNSPRNLLILGVSMYFGLCLPIWLQENTNAIDTGSDILDQILTILFSTSMFVGGLIGFVLDNTIPGTDEERGILIWRNIGQSESTSEKGLSIYNMPFQKYLDKITCFRYLPLCPAFLRVTIDSEINGGSGEVKRDFDNPAVENDLELNSQL